MKVRICTILKAFILFVVLIEYDYFRFFGLGDITRDSYIFLLMMSVGLISLLGGYKKRPSNRQYYHRVNVIVSITLIFAVAEFLYTLMVYNSKPFETFSVITRWLAILFVYPIIYTFEHEKGQEKYIINSILVLGTVMYVIKIVIWYFYNYRGVVIAPQIIYEYGEEWTRNNLFRIDDSSMMYIFLFGCLTLFNKSKKRRYLFLIGVQILYSVFVTAARSSTVSIICLIVIYYLMLGRNSFSKFKKYLIVGTGVAVTIGTTFFQNFVNSFRLSGSNSSLSSVARVNGFLYYINTLAKMNNPVKYIFGLGALSTNVVNEKSILRGPLGIYYIEDLGIIGFILQYCFVACILIISLYIVFRHCSKGYLSKTKNFAKIAEINLLICCFFIPSVLSQCVFDRSRIASFPFYVALILYNSRNNEKKLSTIHH